MAENKERKTISMSVILPLGLQGLIIAGLAVAAAFIKDTGPVKPGYLAIAAWVVLAMSWLFMIKSVSTKLSGTAVSEEELASALGEAVSDGFKNYLPQPDAIAKAITDAMKPQVDAIEKASKASAEAMTKAQTEGSTKIQDALSAEIKQLTEATASWNESLQKTLTDHAQNLTAANDKLAQELEKITAMSANIEQVLHVQETVEQAVTSVSASTEFKEALTALRSHLAEADTLIREASKPRKIRLVESAAS